MPGYGDVAANAARGWWLASCGRVQLPGDSEPTGLQVERLYQEGSLLTQNFNTMWCWALNRELAGDRVDYFAMQHADIEPEQFWLDKLICELEARQLDVLGVVAPIKDMHGLTSIALEQSQADPFRPLCRLTMAEVFRLPPTFTQEDVGYPLLLNTGLWVCRFDSEWAKQVLFTINDAIVYNQATQGYVAQVEPEDWNFSRQCNRLGLKLGVTRKVTLDHLGRYRFTNMTSWGASTFDRANLEESVLPISNFVFPEVSGGQLTYEEGKALADLAAGKTVVAVGSDSGQAAICLAQKAEQVYAVPQPQGDTFDAFCQHVKRYRVQSRVTLAGLPLESLDLSHIAADLVFIDGEDDFESLRQIAEAAILQTLKPDGLLVFSACCEDSSEPGAAEAVADLLACGGRLVARQGGLAIVQPPSLEALRGVGV